MVTFSVHSQKILQITGKVTDGKEPIADVKINVKDTEISTFTDSSGRYRIKTPPRKTLVYSFVGMKSVEYLVEDISTVVNMELYPEVEELDEVVVRSRRKTYKELEEEYDTNKNLIKTYFGILDRERAPFAMNVFDGDQLGYVSIDFIGALQSLVPGIQVSRTNPLRPTVFLPRRFNTFFNPRPVAYDVDGVLMTEAPTEIQVFNIKRIAVIPSASALARYGQLAAGGLIIINTRNGVFNPTGKSIIEDKAKLRNNVFDPSKLKRISHAPKQKDVEKLYTLKSKMEADAYLNQHNLLEKVSTYNAIDIAEYYVQQWDDKERFLQILKGLADKNKTNPVVLKSIAYQLEYYDELEEALGIYQKVFKLRPGYAQSYRDLSRINNKTGNFEKSFDLLSRYIKYRGLEELKIPAQGIDSVILTDYEGLLLAKHRNDNGGLATGPESEETVRMVFEWSHGDAEFDMQFVNPDNRFFIWEHSLEKDAALIKREKQLGYSSEQFFTGKDTAGRWQVNIKYLGNRSYDPTYLKVTVYYNSGTAYEREEVQLFKLTEKNVSYELFSFVNNPVKSALSP